MFLILRPPHTQAAYVHIYLHTCLSTQGKHVYIHGCVCAYMEMEGKIKMGSVELQVGQTEELASKNSSRGASACAECQRRKGNEISNQT